MGYFNYFIKQFIRIFTKKFFWVILIIISILGTYHFVFADYLYDFRDDTLYYNTDELPLAVYETVSQFPEFNDSDYSIFIYYYSSYPYACIISDSGDITYDLYNWNNGINNKFVLTNYHYIKWYGINADGTINDVGNPETVHNFTELGIKVLYMNRTKCYIVNNDLLNDDYILQENVEPFIANTTSTITNWSFDYLVIELGDYSPYYTYIDYPVLKDFILDIDVNNTSYHLNINQYLVNDSAFYIPKAVISNYFVVRDGLVVDFDLSAYSNDINPDFFSLNAFTLSLTSSEQEIINQDSDKYQLGTLVEGQQQIIEGQQEIVEGQQEIKDVLTDSSIDNITSDTLPSDNTVDITTDGINGIFTSIYNAFCTGQPQDIVFPIPFTNKSITLSPSYIYDSLNTAGAGFIITLIQAFWWYLISRFIVKDIADKMNKIKSGNIERIENSNIKEGML